MISRKSRVVIGAGWALLLSACAINRSDSATALSSAGLPLEAALLKTEPLTMIPPGSHGLAVGPDGRVWFADTFSKWTTLMHVYSFKIGEPASLGPSGLKGDQPAGMAWHDGSLYICEVSGGRIVRYDFDRDGKASAGMSWSVASPWNLAFLPTKELVAVSGGGAVVQLLADGSSKELFAGLDAPFDVEVGADGKSLWVSEMGAKRVTLRSLDGAMLDTVKFSFHVPEGLLIDGAGRLWVADTQSSLLVRYDPVSKVVSTVKTDHQLPISLAQGSDGKILLNGQRENGEWWLLRLSGD